MQQLLKTEKIARVELPFFRLFLGLTLTATSVDDDYISYGYPNRHVRFQRFGLYRSWSYCKELTGRVQTSAYHARKYPLEYCFATF